MYSSREMIKKCFNCRNNIQCWELDRDIPEGVNPRKIKIKQYSLLKVITRAFLRRDFKTGIGLEYVFIRVCLDTFNSYLCNNGELCHNYTSQVLAVLEMHANCKDCNWCCPGDDPESNQDFTYDPIRIVIYDRHKD